MLLFKRMSAWSFLYNMIDPNRFDDETYNKIVNLYNDIMNHDLSGVLDNMVNYEFPNGVEEDELTDFFINEQDFIRKELGIKKDDD